MDEARVTFACSHSQPVSVDAELGSVVCTTCGERRVQRVFVDPPRFRAVDCPTASMGPRVTHG